MRNKPVSTLLLAIALLALSASPFSQELELERYAVTVPSLGPSQVFVAHEVPRATCVCTNLQSVTVICEDCDKETRVEHCYSHDRACQDAAQKGGIREHSTFFCTTAAE